MNRRTFLAASAIPLVPALPAVAHQATRRPCVISSGNGMAAIARAMELIAGGTDPLEATVAGVAIVESDPDDMSVGYGGLPNEHGVVQLDASVMHGPTHTAGAVAALENIRNPAQVALEVLKRTDHVLLVGAGALAFARAVGFEEQNLLTERARKAWLRWKANLSRTDDWLDRDQQIEIPHTDGTIHLSAVNAAGDIGACTSTSGLSYKLPGRVGDSPIIGAGMFVDNQVGSAGATGRGEAVIQSAGSFAVVRAMDDGLEPTKACLKVLTWIADHTKRRVLLNGRGEPAFQVTLYALRKDGVYGAASMRKGASYSVHEGTKPRKVRCRYLFGGSD
ncbi:MAG: asparaginase [Planctomycetota bacterium]|nr:MAG: asparaginase [Planctomycetota bacterium]